MKKIIVFDCGQSILEVSQQFGYAPDWIIEILRHTECTFRRVKAFEGETVTYRDGDAWIITGSPQSVYDELDWMLDLEDKIRKTQSLNKAILGICFGHQIIAKSFGGRVELNPNGWELGAYPIELTKMGLKSGLLSGFLNNTIVYQSHGDCVITLPENAVELAVNNKGTQAIKFDNNIYGVQFHPEFTWDIIKKYVSVRSASGIAVDDPSVPESDGGEVVLHNFIELV